MAKRVISDEERGVVRRNIAAFRRELAASQAAVAAQAGISLAAVCSYEAGRHVPDIGALRRLSRIFGRSMDEFFDPSPGPPSRTPAWQVGHVILGSPPPELIRRLEEAIARINKQAEAAPHKEDPGDMVPLPGRKAGSRSVIRRDLAGKLKMRQEAELEALEITLGKRPRPGG